MALSDRDIVITPNKGQTDDPKIVFSGANANVSAQTITLRVYPDNNGTLSFEGSAGQLFSITNDLTGTLFSVNDSSGIPSLEVNADGTITLAEFSGNVGIGTGTPNDKLHVEGTVRAAQFSLGNGTVSSPSFEFYNDPDTGIYLSDTNTLSFVTNGTIASSFTATGDLRLYNTAGTFYSQFSNQPTANRTLTVPDISGTVSLIQSAATAGYFDTSATTPTGTTRLNYGGYFYPTFVNLVGTSDTATAATHYFVETGSDGFVRPKTLANVKAELLGNQFTAFTGATAARTYTLPDANATLATTGNLSQFAATTSAQLAGIISDETGSGALVFGTSPTFTTSIDSGATFGAFASSTALTLGYTSTASSTTNISTGVAASGSTKTINIGTAGASGSITNINIGSATSGATGNTIINSTSLIVPGNMSLGASILATTGPILTLGTVVGGTGYMNGTHDFQALSGGTGAGALGNVTVSGGIVTAITLGWGGNRYTANDVLTVSSLTTTLATTAASGTGTAATLTFALQPAAPFQIGAQIIVAGVTPTGYNGTFTVTGCTTTTVTYANATTGAQTVAGTVKMGAALTNSTVPVATIAGSDLYVSSAPSTSIGARIRLEYNANGVAAGYEYGAIAFSSRDISARGSGDLALIRGVAVGSSGGSNLEFWTAANGTAPNLSAIVTSAGNFRMYNADGTFYSELSNSPTANRTVTIPDVAGTMAIIQTASAAGYFDTSTTTPTGTTRLNYGGYLYPTALNLVGTGATSTTASHYYVQTGSDNFVRPKTLANVQSEIVTNDAVLSIVAGTGVVVVNALSSNVYGRFGQNVSVLSSNASTSTTTGAFILSGGAGIAGNINAGGTRNLFTGSVGVGTSAVLGTTANVFSVYGTAMVYGNIDLRNPTGGVSGIYFGNGTYQTTAALSTSSFGAAGTIQIAGAGNTFTGDSGTFVFDTANDRLGIGTAAPTNSLSVWSTATPAWFNTVNSAVSSNNYEILVGNSTSTGTTVGYVNNATVPYGYLSAGTTTRNIIIASNGRVGLGGTTVPQNMLDVNGAVAIGAAFAGARTAPTNGLLVQGSVGIGTITARAGLHVYGAGQTTSAITDAGSQTAFLRVSDSGTAAGNGGGIIFASLQSDLPGSAGMAAIKGLLTNGAGSTIGDLAFSTRNATSDTALTERMRITATGNVGIATTTVQTGYQLQVQGNSAFANRVGIGTTAVLGLSNTLAVFGTASVFGNIDLGNTAAGGSGVYFPDGTFQNTAYVPTTYTTFTYTGNGSTTTYSTSPVTSSNINNTMVYVNGVYQRKETYGWSGTTITFDVAPPNFSTIEIVVIQGVNAPYGSVAGDISVNGNLTVSGGAIIASGSNTYVFNTVAAGVFIGGSARDIQIGNAVSTTKFNSANASINTTTGAVVTTGGVGIGGNINVGGTRSLFTGRVGVGTSAPLGTNANVFTVYGTAAVFGNVDLGNPAGGTSGIYFSDGSYLTSANSSGTFNTKNANYTAVNGDKLLCDTSGGTFTITLPAAPATGTTVTIYDKANFTAIPLTVARNGSTIEGLADDFSLDIGQTRSEIVYDGSTWHIYVSIGPRGLPGAAASTTASVAYSIALG